MRFGIMNTDHTLEEVGKQFDVTRNASVRSKPRRCANCAIRPARAAPQLSGQRVKRYTTPPGFLYNDTW